MHHCQLPNSFIKVLESLKQVIDLIDCENKSEKLKLVEKMNVHRNYEILMHFKQYEFLNEHLELLRENI